MICRHCLLRPVSRPRGLCWTCFYTPEVRALYPISSKFARRGAGIGVRCRGLPPFPTSAGPGSPEKVRVLELRASQGHDLFHPEDERVRARRGEGWNKPTRTTLAREKEFRFRAIVLAVRAAAKLSGRELLARVRAE